MLCPRMKSDAATIDEYLAKLPMTAATPLALCSKSSVATCREATWKR